MRTLLLSGASILSLAAWPVALGAQTSAQTPAQPAATGSAADRANAEARPAPRTTTVTTVGGQTVIATNNPGNLTPPPPEARNRTYPVCSRTVQDSCQNPGEGGAPRRPRG